MTQVDPGFRGLKIEMTGAQTTAMQNVRKALIDALMDDGRFVPEKISTHERILNDFDYEAGCKLAATGIPTQISVYLRRKRVVSYEAILSQSTRSSLIFEFPKTTAQKHWEGVFELGDQIADAYEPDIGYTQLRNFAYEHFPTTAQCLRTANLLDAGTSIPPSNYFRNGTGGLGYRTYLGPFVLAQLGEDRVRSLPSPAVVTEMSWGGLRVDLVAKPWSAPREQAHESWHACMVHLKPSGWFSTMSVNDRDGGVRFKPPTHDGWDPGGVVR